MSLLGAAAAGEVKKRQLVTLATFLEQAEKNNYDFRLSLLTSNHTMDRIIGSGNVNRPGMNLFGFFDHFAFDRIQVFGKGESAYLSKLEEEGRTQELEKLFTFEIPCCLFSADFTPSKTFVEMAERARIPVAVSDLDTPRLTRLVEDLLDKMLSPQVTLHGVMMEIFGMGVFIQGKRGVGKSECALELLERGHRFIADDVVDIRLYESNILMATSSSLITHHMEIRGIGIINIAFLFGVRAILNEKPIDLVIELEQYDPTKKYDRLGLDLQEKTVLDVKTPSLTIPIQPGTNIPILIETATMNQRLKMMGYNPASEFNKKLMSLIDRGEEIF